MGPTIVATAIRKGLSWLATRGKGVSRHVSNHTRKAANVAARNPRYAARAMGRGAHSMFADPRPRKLIEKVLRKYDNAIVQSNGRVLVEKQFNRVIGKANETIVRVVIDSRTGRIITAFPVAAFANAAHAATAAAPLPAPEASFIGASFDERLIEAIAGVEKLAREWERTKPRPREDIWTLIFDVIFDPTPAGEADEELHVRVHHYLSGQADLMLKELEAEIGHKLPPPTRRAMREQFFDAVAGAGGGDDAGDEW